jgi:RNA polymerase sigma-B factor
MHPPTRDELSARLSVAPADLDQALRAAEAWDALSLDAPASGPRDSIDESAQLAELLGTPDTQLDSVEDRLTMRELIGKLPAREQKILALKFYGNVSQAGIAKATGVSQMHVSRLLSRALCWLREAMLSDITPPWPGLDGEQDAVDLVVGVRHDNGTVTVSIRGEIDRDTSNSLRRQLEFYCRRAHTGVRVDLRQAPFIDNAGLSGIAACYRVAHGRHIEFGLTHANPTVVRGMQIAGLAHLVNA